MLHMMSTRASCSEMSSRRHDCLKESGLYWTMRMCRFGSVVPDREPQDEVDVREPIEEPEFTTVMMASMDVR